ncbi:MAG: DUF779 domain-containing protein [Burkholderiaceae bacterium]|nr:DUF779 domain-containing protein [Burkholderiaceae bacterium]
MTSNLVDRVIATDSALALLSTLTEMYGPLMLFQSGACIDGDSPQCHVLGEFCVGNADVYLGNLDGTPFYMGHEQFEYWRHAQLIVDVAHGMEEIGAHDSGIGNCFVTHSRLFSEDEKQQLEQTPSTAASW